MNLKNTCHWRITQPIFLRMLWNLVCCSVFFSSSLCVLQSWFYQCAHPFPVLNVIKKYYDTIWESQIVTAVVYLILFSRIYYCLGILWARWSYLCDGNQAKRKTRTQTRSYFAFKYILTNYFESTESATLDFVWNSQFFKIKTKRTLKHWWNFHLYNLNVKVTNLVTI